MKNTHVKLVISLMLAMPLVAEASQWVPTGYKYCEEAVACIGASGCTGNCFCWDEYTCIEGGNDGCTPYTMEYRNESNPPCDNGVHGCMCPSQ